jgi:hypothetical protein
MRRVRLILYWLNAGGLAYCWAVHLSTFLIVRPPLNGLELLAFLAIPVGALGFSAAVHRTSGNERWLRYSPWWLVGMSAALLAYLAAILVFADRPPPGYWGQAQRHDGGYALVSHGRVLRTITEEEYHLIATRQARRFPFLGMIFSAAGLSALAMSLRRERRTGLDPASAAGGRLAEPNVAPDRRPLQRSRGV